jgi:hypothetical protein
MLRVSVIALSLAIWCSPLLIGKANAEKAKKGQSYEECQKRAIALGMRIGNRANPNNPNAHGFLAQCMRGEV